MTATEPMPENTTAWNTQFAALKSRRHSSLGPGGRSDRAQHRTARWLR